MTAFAALRQLAQEQYRQESQPAGWTPVALPIPADIRWTLSETYLDDKGGKELTPAGDIVWVDGPFVGSKSLQVYNQWSGATIQDNIIATAGNTKTISAWIYTTNRTYYQWQNVISYGGSTTGWTALSISPTGYIDWRWSDASSNYHVEVSTTQIEENTWQLVTVTLDATNNVAKIYLNGQKIGEDLNAGIGTQVTGETISIGWNGATYGQFQGRIHDLQIWDNYLTDADVLLMYQTYTDTVPEAPEVPVVTGDGDADLFIYNVEAEGLILSQTEIDALDDLVTSLKTNGTWDNYKAIYPMVGASANGHKYNLKDPRDLDAAYRLDFRGTWTHDANGAKGDGVSAYAQTFFRDNDIPTLVDATTVTLGIGFYSNDQGTSGNYKAEMGGDGNGGSLLDILMQLDDGGGQWRQFYGPNGMVDAVPGYQSMVYYNATGAVMQEFKDGVPYGGTSALSKGPTNAYICIAGMGQTDPAVQGTSQDFNSNARCALAVISDGLSDADVTADYTVFQAFQTALSRNN
jgi:hypothetical protein